MCVCVCVCLCVYTCVYVCAWVLFIYLVNYFKQILNCKLIPQAAFRSAKLLFSG